MQLGMSQRAESLPYQRVVSRPGVAELADAADSKSAGDHSPCGFDSLLRDQQPVVNTHGYDGSTFCASFSDCLKLVQLSVGMSVELFRSLTVSCR